MDGGQKFILAVGAVIVALGVYSGYRVFSEGKPTKDTALTASAEIAPTVEEALAAMVRAHPNSIRVCYDSAFGYYAEYIPYPKRGAASAPDDGFLRGTWLIGVKEVKFYKSANGTWFANGLDHTRYIQVYPDLNNLPCAANTQ